MEFDLSKIKFSDFDIKRCLKLPIEMTPELAEFLGIMVGDGCISHKLTKDGYQDYFISISGNKILDKEYFEGVVTPLFKSLFNLNVKYNYHKNQNTISTAIRSKGLFEFLKFMGISPAPKNYPYIPIIISRSNLVKWFLIGLFDTDGCLCLKKRHTNFPYYPTITITQKSRGIIENLEKVLKDIGLTVTVRYDEIRYRKGTKTVKHKLDINGRRNFEKWMVLIGFHNSRNLLKADVCKSAYTLGKIQTYYKSEGGVDRIRG